MLEFFTGNRMDIAKFLYRQVECILFTFSFSNKILDMIAKM